MDKNSHPKAWKGNSEAWGQIKYPKNLKRKGGRKITKKMNQNMIDIKLPNGNSDIQKKKKKHIQAMTSKY